MIRALLVALLVLAPAGGALAQPAPAPTEPAPAPNTGARGFRADAAPGAEARTPEQALDRCIADVARLERDAIGVPFLAAAYIAFFVILGVFFVLVRVRQRRMEEEMSELRHRLAALQERTP
ncbi:MAG: hypothetical protein IT385_27640 [Deltaproteobacteria bacterium]|nr:hypothetical protein [Deltaproteobacteria bacterium]